MGWDTARPKPDFPHFLGDSNGVLGSSEEYFCVLSDLVAKAAVLAKRGIRMTWAIRSSALAVAAAAMLSSQAVYAAPAATQTTAVDPLVSLSMLSTTQATPSSLMAASMATSAAAAQDAPPPAAYGGEPKSMTLPLILGMLAIIGIAVAIASGGGNGHGDLTPISPA